MSELLLDRAGRRRSPATPCLDFTPAVRHETETCVTPADPPKVEEIIAVMRAAGDRPTVHSRRAPMTSVTASLRLSRHPSPGAAHRAEQHSSIGAAELRSQAEAAAR